MRNEILDTLLLLGPLNALIKKYDSFFEGICVTKSDSQTNFPINNIGVLPSGNIVCTSKEQRYFKMYTPDLQFMCNITTLSYPQQLKIFTDKIFLISSDHNITVWGSVKMCVYF